MTLVRNLGRGAVAGALGTLAMDALWYRRYRDGGGEEAFLDWELAGATSSFDEAGAPAKMGKRIADAVEIDLPDDAAGTVTNVVHWLTGVGYGAVVQAVVADRRNVAASGLATGVGAFAASYAVLGSLGLYQPIWEYEADTLRDDLTAHLAFGAVTALAFRVLSWRGR